MPFVGVDRPAIGLGLLKAQLNHAGIPCDIRHLTFSLASFIGLEDYIWISDGLSYTAFVGDWLFTGFLYGKRPQEELAYAEEILVKTWKLTLNDIKRILKIRVYCGHFLDYCMESIPWSDYSVVGFTSTFTQNIASLALAKRIKRLHPDITIIFGGANWEGEMGHALHEKFDFVDFVCSGEADKSFPALISGLGTPGFKSDKVPGLVYRRNGTSVSTGQTALVTDLNKLPYPDYDEFFRDYLDNPVTSELIPNLLFETSRGCWWGAKRRCKFCGLSGSSYAFRSKDADRAIKEICYLQDRYGCNILQAVDNIFDMKYFKTLLPKIVKEELNLSLFYEVKANLTREQVRQLAEAGIDSVQPGIESLSDHILKLMNKGITALQNIQLLKWCKEYG
ncbi:MAG: RiPP maturation radical SAM protein 1, partial [Gammaproteobacteria bacterium]|nr:RiPP maturation radical SAM protein 1 [Gammaproteobacteria bacterium]